MTSRVKRANKEATAWRNNPFTFKASEGLVVFLRRNINRNRQALMCRNCGCVFVVGGDVLRAKKTSQHVYCDDECKYADRSRIYKANWQQHVNACEKIGKKKRWPHSKVHKKQCTECSNAFYAQRNWQCQCCDDCVQTYKQRIGEEQKKAAATKCRLAYRQQRIEEARKTSTHTTCKECNIAFTAIVRPSREFCSDDCAKKYHRKSRKHARRERMKLPDGVMRGKTSLGYIIKKFKGRCCCCRQVVVRSKKYQPNQATVDHVVPLAKGGLHVEDNLQLMCMTCNSRKSDGLQVESAQLSLF